MESILVGEARAAHTFHQRFGGMVVLSHSAIFPTAAVEPCFGLCVRSAPVYLHAVDWDCAGSGRYFVELIHMPVRRIAHMRKYLAGLVRIMAFT